MTARLEVQERAAKASLLHVGAICPREKALGEWLRASALAGRQGCVRTLLFCANAPSPPLLPRYGSLWNPKTKLALRLQA